MKTSRPERNPEVTLPDITEAQTGPGSSIFLRLRVREAVWEALAWA
jgi:hypothetical protein